MEDSAFKLCPFCKQQIRREAIKCRFCGEWLESSEADPARKLTTDKPFEPPRPPHKGNEPVSMRAVGRALDETYPQQRSDGSALPIVEGVVAMQSETAGASENRVMSAEAKKPTAWIAAAVILPLAFSSWFLLGRDYLGSFWVPGAIVLSIATCFLPLIICGLKEKFVFVAISLIGILLFSRVQILFEAAFALAMVGAIRIAKPRSRWARRYYGPKKMALALARFALPREKDNPIVPPSLPPQKGNEPTPIPDIQNKTTSKASARAGGKKTKTRVIIAIAAVILAVFVIETAIVNDQWRSTSSRSNVAAFDPQHEAAAEAYLQNLGLEKFTSNEFGFTVMMPKQRTTAKMDIGTVFKAEVNGHGVGVIAKDLPPSDPLYSMESISALRGELLRGLTRNKNVSEIQFPQNVKDRNGHVGAEMVYTLTYGNVRYHEQGYGFHVGHRVCVVQVTASEAQWDKQLGDSVLTTFAMQ